MSKVKKDLVEKGAVIQRDRQTYAITPHLPAGLTTPEQLEQIAAVARRFGAQLKCSSAQRIVLLGLQEEDLDAAWEALGGMPRGRGFGPCVRSVKICPGTDFCKRAQQDSVSLGLKLDALYQARELPWKLKMSVSGCMNDCAETCIKDIGILGTPKGWHLQVGGNGGAAPRLSRRLLENLQTEAEVLAAVELLVDWFVAQQRYCRLGKMVDELGIEELRRITLGEKPA
jgi:NAD(P)H-nitrite reductase large subunit